MLRLIGIEYGFFLIINVLTHSSSHFQANSKWFRVGAEGNLNYNGIPIPWLSNGQVKVS